MAAGAGGVASATDGFGFSADDLGASTKRRRLFSGFLLRSFDRTSMAGESESGLLLHKKIQRTCTCKLIHESKCTYLIMKLIARGLIRWAIGHSSWDEKLRRWRSRWRQRKASQRRLIGKRQKERIKAGRWRGAINQRRGAPEEQTTGTGRAPERPEAPEAAPVPGTLPEAGAEAAEGELWSARGSIVRSSGATRKAGLNDAPRGIAGSPD